MKTTKTVVTRNYTGKSEWSPKLQAAFSDYYREHLTKTLKMIERIQTKVEKYKQRV